MWPGPSWNFYSGGGDPLQMTPEINVRKELANTSHYKEKDVLQTRYPKIPLSKTSPPFTAEKLSSLKQHITQETTSAQQGRAHALQPHQSPLLSLLLPEALSELSRKEPLYPASCCTTQSRRGACVQWTGLWGPRCNVIVLSSLPSGWNMPSQVFQKLKRQKHREPKGPFLRLNLKWLLDPGGFPAAQVGEHVTCAGFPTLASSVLANRTG